MMGHRRVPASAIRRRAWPRSWGAARGGLLALLLALASIGAAPVGAGEGHFLLASTTSLENSGFLDHLERRLFADTGLDMRVIVTGTGQALKSAERGDVDAVFVHHPDSEKEFLAKGFASRRAAIMGNDFLLVGPRGAPPLAADSIEQALGEIHRRRAPFLSRGDDSGTHRKERALWRSAGLAPWKGRSSAPGVPLDAWYYEGGVGMAPLLRAADALGAYTLVDRATWEKFRPSLDLDPVYEGEGEPGLINTYSVLLVHPGRHPHVRARAGRRFIEWLTSPRGRRAVFSFRIHDRQVFHPLADPAEPAPH